ncbi:MAG: Nramp family divalent metal transporter [Candidatus Aminicenantaceae bacterium]
MAGKSKKISFGPGFLVTAAFIGPGTVTTCSIAGANFGYALIFIIGFATVVTLILQWMTGRLSIVSKLDLGEALRKIPRNTLTKILFVVLIFSSITFGCAAYESGNIIGGALGLEMITDFPRKYWVGLISILAILILSTRKYKFVEKFLVFLVFIMSLSFLITLVIIKPDLSQVVKGFIPSFPKNSLYIVLALIGTTVVPYNLFLHSSAVKEKWKSISDLKKVNKDLIYALFLGGFISASIIITSAVAFFYKGIPLKEGAQLAYQLKPLFGDLATFFFGAGFFAAGLSSAITAPYAASFASSGILGWKNKRNSPGFTLVWLAVILTGFTVSCFKVNALAIIVFAQVANGLVLPIASIFLLIVLNNRERMGKYMNSPIQNILGIAIVIIVTIIGLWNILKFFIK